MRPCSRRYAWWAIESASRAFCSTRSTVIPSRFSPWTIWKICSTTSGASPSDGSPIMSRRAGADVGPRQEFLARGHVREDEAVLGHQRDPAADDVGGRSPRQLPSLEGDRAAPRPEDPRDGVEQGGLAGAAGAQAAGAPARA